MSMVCVTLVMVSSRPVNEGEKAGPAKLVRAVVVLKLFTYINRGLLKVI